MPNSPLEKTPHKARNGEISITCRNRHCPKCQNRERAKWLEDRKAEMLPVEYFHVVFTIPEELAPIAFYNKDTVYGILFRAASETMLTIARDSKHLGAEIGFFAVLHTWGQNLQHHRHIHCVVSGGGLSPDYEHWNGCKPASSCPCAFSHGCFDAFFSKRSKMLSIKAGSAFSGRRNRFRMPLSSTR